MLANANKEEHRPKIKHPTHAHLFVVVGGEVEDSGRGLVFVSTPYLRLPQITLRTSDSPVFINHQPKEYHSLRHGPENSEIIVVTTIRGTELRSIM